MKGRKEGREEKRGKVGEGIRRKAFKRVYISCQISELGRKVKTVQSKEFLPRELLKFFFLVLF